MMMMQLVGLADLPNKKKKKMMVCIKPSKSIQYILYICILPSLESGCETAAMTPCNSLGLYVCKGTAVPKVEYDRYFVLYRYP